METPFPVPVPSVVTSTAAGAGCLESKDGCKTSSKAPSSQLEMGSSRASCLEKGDTQLSV